MYGEVFERLDKLSLESKVPCTVHILINNEDKVACGKRASGEIVEHVQLASNAVESQRRSDPNFSRYTESQINWYFAHTRYDNYLRRTKSHRHARGVLVTICGLCKRATEERISKDALSALQSSKANDTPTAPTAPVQAPTPDGGEEGLLEPTRPAGTEEMTGHLDEGSLAGGCAEAGAGFRTKYMPWINCTKCLIFLDEAEESDLLFLRGRYVESKK